MKLRGSAIGESQGMILVRSELSVGRAGFYIRRIFVAVSRQVARPGGAFTHLAALGPCMNVESTSPPGRPNGASTSQSLLQLKY